MTSPYPARPLADEHTPYYGRYIALVPEGDLVAMLARQGEETAALLASLTPAQARYRPAPGEWNTIEIVGHLADTERVLAYRAMRIARADPTPLEGVDDFAPYVPTAGFAQRPLADVAEEFATVRQAACRSSAPLIPWRGNASAWRTAPRQRARPQVHRRGARTAPSTGYPPLPWHGSVILRRHRHMVVSGLRLDSRDDSEVHILVRNPGAVTVTAFRRWPATFTDEGTGCLNTLLDTMSI